MEWTFKGETAKEKWTTKAQLPVEHTLQKVSLDYKCGNSPEGQFTL